MTSTEFFKFIKERHRIFLRKEEGRPWPWTKDVIFQTYKFTNVFRENDRVTRWIREREAGVWSASPRVEDFKRMVFWTIGARWFNRLETLEILCSAPYRFGYLEHNAWYAPRVEDLLRGWRPKGPWVTGAYIIRTPTGLNLDKLAGVLSDIDLVHKDLDGLFDRWAGNPTLEWATEDLLRYRDIGPFMAYEIVSDLRWSVLSGATDILTWANPGPGALRGLGWVLVGDPGAYPRRADTLVMANREMRSLLKEWRGGKGPRRGSRKAEMRDVEHSLCEFDKYMRVTHGLGRPREKYHAP